LKLCGSEESGGVGGEVSKEEGNMFWMMLESTIEWSGVSRDALPMKICKERDDSKIKE